MPHSACILYVEDVPDMREQISGMLNDIGYKVLTADSLSDAEKILWRAPIDIFVIDIRLDERVENNRDGFRLAEIIRAQGMTQPIIFLTAYSHEFAVVNLVEIHKYPYPTHVVSKSNVTSVLLPLIAHFLGDAKRRVSCFLASPASTGVNATGEVYEEIKKIAENRGLVLTSTLARTKSGFVFDDVRQHLKMSHIVIADVSHEDLGVYYALGYASAVSKRLILICQENTCVPGFLTFFQPITYSDRYSSMNTFIGQLNGAIENSINALSSFDNFPINETTAVKRNVVTAIVHQSDMVEEFQREILRPSGHKLDIQLQTLSAASHLGLTLGQMVDHVQLSSVLVTEITKVDTFLACCVGIADALRRPLIIMLREHHDPAFIWSNFIQVYHYGITNAKARAAQTHLESKIRNGINSDIPSLVEETLNQDRLRLSNLLSILFHDTTSRLDTYFYDTWSADERVHKAAGIQQAENYVKKEADSLADTISKASSPAEFRYLETEVVRRSRDWYQDALDEIP